MIRFLDGLAAGVILELTRAPIFLRVVRDTAGQWDALDQLGDMPAAGETIHVYVKAADRGTVHVQAQDRRGRRVCRWLASATYRQFEQQPDDATARDTTAWRTWCAARQAERLAT